MQISRCIEFYAGLFKKSAKKDWSEVRELAMTFEPTIRKNWPAYLEEMGGQYHWPPMFIHIADLFQALRRVLKLTWRTF